jgi:glycosyltransferase involved in cell wall biosynthesis
MYNFLNAWADVGVPFRPRALQGSVLPKISAVIISFNEELDIARAIASLAWCDEVLIVDSGSTDRTIEVCQAYGCKVLHRDFTGYGEQKAWAVAQAANDWILALDADEEVPAALKEEIASRLALAENCSGYYIPITTVLWDQVVRTGHRHTKPKLRLFDRRFGNFRKQLVHESVAVEGRTEHLRQPMYNYSYSSIADYFDKFNRYTSLSALESFRPGERPSFLKAVAALPLTFIQFYFLKGFIWDGSAGLTWSLFSSFYPAVKYFKLSEFQRTYAQQQIAEGLRSSPLPAPQHPIARERSAPIFADELMGTPPYEERVRNG